MITKRRIYGWVVLLFSMYLIVNISRNVWHLWNAQGAIADTERQVSDLYKQQAKLKSELESVQSSEFIEREARESLNLVKPGETVVLLPPKVPVVVKYEE